MIEIVHKINIFVKTEMFYIILMFYWILIILLKIPCKNLLMNLQNVLGNPRKFSLYSLVITIIVLLIIVL